MPFELSVHRCVTLGALLNLSEQKLSYTGYKVWRIVMIVTDIKEAMHIRMSRTGSGSEQVLKIVVLKKIFLISMISLVTIVTMVLFIFFYVFQFSLSYTPANTWHNPAF